MQMQSIVLWLSLVVLLGCGGGGGGSSGGGGGGAGGGGGGGGGGGTTTPALRSLLGDTRYVPYTTSAQYVFQGLSDGGFYESETNVVGSSSSYRISRGGATSNGQIYIDSMSFPAALVANSLSRVGTSLKPWWFGVLPVGSTTSQGAPYDLIAWTGSLVPGVVTASYISHPGGLFASYPAWQHPVDGSSSVVAGGKRTIFLDGRGQLTAAWDWGSFDSGLFSSGSVAPKFLIDRNAVVGAAVNQFGELHRSIFTAAGAIAAQETLYVGETETPSSWQTTVTPFAGGGYMIQYYMQLPGTPVRVRRFTASFSSSDQLISLIEGPAGSAGLFSLSRSGTTGPIVSSPLVDDSFGLIPQRLSLSLSNNAVYGIAQENGAGWIVTCSESTGASSTIVALDASMNVQWARRFDVPMIVWGQSMSRVLLMPSATSAGGLISLVEVDRLTGAVLGSNFLFQLTSGTGYTASTAFFRDGRQYVMVVTQGQDSWILLGSGGSGALQGWVASQGSVYASIFDDVCSLNFAQSGTVFFSRENLAGVPSGLACLASAPLSHNPVPSTSVFASSSLSPVQQVSSLSISGIGPVFSVLSIQPVQAEIQRRTVSVSRPCF